MGCYGSYRLSVLLLDEKLSTEAVALQARDIPIRHTSVVELGPLASAPVTDQAEVVATLGTLPVMYYNACRQELGQ